MHATIAPQKTLQNVLGGTGRYAGLTGGSTLEATLDMSQFATGTVTFDCVYGISLQ